MSADQLDENASLPRTDPTTARSVDPAADRLARLETEVANLRDGLESRTQIGIAIGIVAVHYRCTSSQAWSVLTRVSSHTNLKVREVGRLVTAVIDGTVRPGDAESLALIAPHLPTLAGAPAAPGVPREPRRDSATA